jgi:class 3 adenylate cyclase
VEEQIQPDGSVRYFGKTRFGSYQLAWEEIPSNWQENLWLTHGRVFSAGPFRRLFVRVLFEPRPTGCRCEYTLEVEPANLVGRLLLRTGFFRSTGHKFHQLATHFRAHLEGDRKEPFPFVVPTLDPRAVERCRRISKQLSTSPLSHGLADRLAEWISRRPESEVATLRPKTLARIWDLPTPEVTELCLLAAHQGLLSLRWDLLCPNCRIGKASVLRLDQLPEGAHCGTCNIDYERDFNRNVELVFSPAQTIRAVSPGEYCLFGPRSTPHITAQLRVEPGTTRREGSHLRPGHFRIRTLEPGPAEILDWNGHELPKITILPDGRIHLGPPLSPKEIIMENLSSRPRTLIIEERSWLQDVLTAAEAATLPAFRELFHDQVLRPGDTVQVDNVVLLFTDIRASASLYDTLGDAAAYARVREHFATLAGCIRGHRGAVVKTIGDAVMAVFPDPGDGFRCAQAIQQSFAQRRPEPGSAGTSLTVKVGLHLGPCLTVNWNGILDYFGSTANLTARLVSLAHGGDVVMSRAFAEDPAVAPLLSAMPTESHASEVKGFARPIAWVRAMPGLAQNKERWP